MHNRRNINEFECVCLIVSKDGFEHGTCGTIVHDYGEGHGYRMEITEPRAGLITVMREEVVTIDVSVPQNHHHIFGGWYIAFYSCTADDVEECSVWEWLGANIETSDYSFSDYSYGRILYHFIWFADETDAILFAMRWQGTEMMGLRFDHQRIHLHHMESLEWGKLTRPERMAYVWRTKNV